MVATTTGNNQYFLSGKLEALDVAGEWFRSSPTASSFFPPEQERQGRRRPGVARHRCRVRWSTRREFCHHAAERWEAKGCGSGSSLSLALTGLALRRDVSLPCCHSCRLDRLDLSFPTYSREIIEMDAGHEGHDYGKEGTSLPFWHYSSLVLLHLGQYLVLLCLWRYFI